MNFLAFVALWQHRFRKITYIVRAYGQAYAIAARLYAHKQISEKPLVAILRTEHFGDIVAAEPLARQVRERHPTAHVVWIVRPVFAELVARHPAVNETLEQRSVLQRLVLCESGVFDYLYNLEFWQSNRDAVTERVHQNPMAVREDITIFNYLEKGNLLTIFQLLAGLPLHDDTPRVYIQDTERRRVDALALPPRFVALHCSSNYPVKDWSVPHWERLIEYFIANDFDVVEVGLKSSNHVAHPRYRNLCGQLSILETAEVIRRARYFVGIDSGPAHLANAVGTYGILLFGRLNNFDNYPIYSGGYGNGTNATIIRQPGKPCSELEYELVEATIAKLLIS